MSSRSNIVECFYAVSKTVMIAGLLFLLFTNLDNVPFCFLILYVLMIDTNNISMFNHVMEELTEKTNTRFALDNSRMDCIESRAILMYQGIPPMDGVTQVVPQEDIV